MTERDLARQVLDAVSEAVIALEDMLVCVVLEKADHQLVEPLRQSIISTRAAYDAAAQLASG